MAEQIRQLPPVEVDRLVPGGDSPRICPNMLQFVKTVPKGVELKLQKIGTADRPALDVDAAGMRAVFNGMSVENFPELPAAPSPTAMIPGAILADALRKTTFAVANEESRYTLIGSLFEIQGEALTVVSTDGHRLSHYKTAGDVASTSDFRGLVRKSALVLIEKMLKRSKGKGEAQLAELTIPAPEHSKREAERIAYVWIGDALLTTRLLSGQFPDYERVIPKSHLGENTATVDRQQFAQALKQAGAFADKRSHAVRFAVNGSMVIEATGTDSGSGKVAIPVEHVGLDVNRIGFNHKYLLDLLAAIDSERVTLDFGKATTTTPVHKRRDDGSWGYEQEPIDGPPIFDNALLVATDSAQFVVMPMSV